MRIQEAIPATGKRGSTAHHHMIDLMSSESGASNPPSEKFPLGHVVSTPGALASIPHDEMQAALRRHHSGDWGDLDDDDKYLNDRALQNDSRLFSQYHAKSRVKFWIITESDRSVTTVLLPSEY